MIVPNRGDLVWINLNPQAGHEQANRHSCIVLSEYDFNRITGFAIICPITRQAKGLAFELPLPVGNEISGVVLTDQVKSLDFQARNIDVVGNIPEDSEFMKDLLDTVSGFFSR